MGASTRFILSSFNGGELSPMMEGRVDQDKYYTGCKKLSNFIPTVQGPIRRRGGTRYVGTAKNGASRAWLQDFVVATAQAYVLEFGDKYVRFWTNRGQLLNAGSPYEIGAPYSAADLVTADGTFALRTLQSADVMWITHVEGKYPPYRLSRLGATNWTLLPDVFTDGPFMDYNSDSAITMYASAAGSVGADITVTCNQPVFQSGHVGSLLRLSSLNPAAVTPYQPAASVAVNDRVRNGGNVYKALDAFTWSTGDTTQRYVPVHTTGIANDGKVRWEYLHSGYGWGKIKAVALDGLSCTLTVTGYMPEECVGVGNTTRRWQFSEFSSVYGWPTGVCFYKERLTYLRGKSGFCSWAGGFTSWDRLDAGLVTSLTGIVLNLSADKLDNIRWAVPMRDLLVGTARSESAVGPQTSQQVFSATNNQHTPQTEYGARLLKPLKAGGSVLFAERAGNRVRDAQYDFATDRYKADDITVLSDHLFDGNEEADDAERDQRDIVDWTYQQQRDSVVWIVRSDGTLVGLTINRERGVIAWAPHYVGGDAFVEGVACIPSPDSRTDDLWLIVRRTVDGATIRTVEYMTDYRLVKKGQAEAVHVDCSYTYRGTPTDTVSGLTWLEGKTVSVCVDGSAHVDVKVVGSSVKLQRAGSLIHVGHGFSSRIQTMRLEVQGPGGTSQTKMKGVGKLYLRMKSTIGGTVGKNFTKMDPIKTQPTGAAVGAPPPLFSGDYKLDFPGGFDADGFICYEQKQPLPATLVALIGELVVND